MMTTNGMAGVARARAAPARAVAPVVVFQAVRVWSWYFYYFSPPT